MVRIPPREVPTKTAGNAAGAVSIASMPASSAGKL
jgi:hypothetical protein